MRTELPLLHHTDQGSQYASGDYQQALVAADATCSMSSQGHNCWENAIAESFFATLKSELIYRAAWPTRDAARASIVEYVTSFYNSRRRHSALGYVSPMNYEAALRMTAMAA